VPPSETDGSRTATAYNYSEKLNEDFEI